MALLVLAYPTLDTGDYRQIQDCRKSRDDLFAAVEPHFTLVFPVADIEEDMFMKEIREKAVGEKSINLVIRRATVSKDDFSENWYTFLLPDKGYSQLVKLHDKLYSGLLAPWHRRDIEFIPHITVARSADMNACRQLADEWNRKDLAISGTIQKLSLVSYVNGQVKELEKILLH